MSGKMIDGKKLLTVRRRGGMPRKPRRWVQKDWRGFIVRHGRLDLHLAAKRGWGVTTWAVAKEGFTTPFWPGLTWYGDLDVIKKRTKAADGGNASHLAPMESNVFAKCHALVAHCAATQFDDHSPRKPGWFTVRTRGSAWEIEIKDPETCSRLVVIQQSLDDALALATVLLDAEDAPWEPDPWLARSQAGSRKKS